MLYCTEECGMTYLMIQAMAARSDVEGKSRVFIAEQQRKLEEAVTSRQVAEQQVKDLQRQLSSLRAQLNTSQENQRDFVELSQALQVHIWSIVCVMKDHVPLLQVKLARIEEEQNLPSSP